MTNFTAEQLAAARANFKTFQTRDPQAAAKLDPLIEGAPRLGNDPRLIQHFAETSSAPDPRALFAMALYGNMKKD
jgi:hypothetical protein